MPGRGACVWASRDSDCAADSVPVPRTVRPILAEILREDSEAPRPCARIRFPAHPSCARLLDGQHTPLRSTRDNAPIPRDRAICKGRTISVGTELPPRCRRRPSRACGRHRQRGERRGAGGGRGRKADGAAFGKTPRLYTIEARGKAAGGHHRGQSKRNGSGSAPPSPPPPASAQAKSSAAAASESPPSAAHGESKCDESKPRSPSSVGTGPSTSTWIETESLRSLGSWRTWSDGLGGTADIPWSASCGCEPAEK